MRRLAVMTAPPVEKSAPEFREATLSKCKQAPNLIIINVEQFSSKMKNETRESGMAVYIYLVPALQSQHWRGKGWTTCETLSENRRGG